jgi:hypothetical protein
VTLQEIFMRNFRLIAAAALMAAALPVAWASDAAAQVKSAAPDRIGGGGGGGAIKGPSIGGGGMVRPPSGWGGGGRPGWSGGGHHRPGWSGGYGHRPHYGYGRRWVGPGIGFGTGLLLGGALASQPYYGSPYYYDDYDDGYVYAAPQGDADDAYCRKRYRSYDPRTRTYLNNDGNRYPCP